MALDILLDNAVRKAIVKGTSIIGLKGGLTIALKAENACILRLTLCRPNQPPSITEWETVLKYFPWPVADKPTTIGNSLSASMVIHPKFL